MMWGKAKENGAWISKVSDWRIITGGDRIVYLAAWKFRLRLMKPDWMIGADHD